MDGTIRVLYAEDNAADADLTEAHFRRTAPHLSLEVVHSGERCLACLQAGTYDVLLLDNRLPDMDGTEVLKTVVANRVPLPVVMVTAAGDESLAVQVLRLGACDYVPKQGNYLETLPLVLMRAVTEYRSLSEQRRASGHVQRRILYVEHHDGDIDLTLVHFANVAPHFTVDVARSAAEALTYLQGQQFDLILADLRMSDMSALDLVREARHRGIAAPFVVITGGGDETAAVAALKLGAFDYIVKRDNYLTQLPYAIENAISRFELLQANRRLHLEMAERERSQRAMSESLALLDSLQNHAPVGIAFLDRDYRFQQVNDEFTVISGLAGPAHTHRTVKEVFPEIWDQLEPLCRHVLGGESVMKVEIRSGGASGPEQQRFWLVSLCPIRTFGPEVEGIGFFLADISERKRAEARLRKHAEDLVDAARQKDEFLAMLSHELRNPLAPIRTALDVIRRTGPGDPAAGHAQEAMGRQIAHMTRLLDDLLDVSRITSGRIQLKLEPVDVRQVIREAVDTVRPLIDARRHRLETSVSHARLFVLGDITRLVQVVVNLLNNAAKYSDEGGTIRVTADAEEGEVVLRVRDTGAGISPRLLPKIFDLFTQDERTLDRAQGGLGLGLTIVRRITELHGGSVVAHSEGRGQGSEFVLKLPLHTHTPDATPQSPPARQRLAQPRRCLIVEDNVDAATMLKTALEFEGYDVRLAFDGCDATQIAASFRPDAIVLDIGLPRLNGYDAARDFRRLPGLANVLIIAVTGYGDDSDRAKSRDAGIDAHLVKPIELDELLRTLSVGRAVRVD